ncbi:UNVERIFIED_CONTAM: putative amino-acid transport system substrate-binding protein [Brevibacillus sp. OAP136]
MKTYLYAFITILLLLVAAGCGGQDKAATTAGTQAKIVKIGGQPDSYPYTFKEGNDIKGFNVDIANAIAEKAGFQIEWSLADWNGIVGQLEVGKIDTVRNFAITEERKKKYDYTQPYSYSGAQIAVSKNNNTIHTFADLKGKKVAAALGQNYANVLKENDPNHEIQLVTYEESEVIYKDLESGRVDAYVAGREGLLIQIKEKNLPLKLAGEPFGEKAVGFPFHKTPENQELIAKIDKAIDELRADATLKKISEKWFGADITTSSVKK